jgi:hypothetical protein
MTVNNSYRKIITTNDEFVNIPLEITFDFDGRSEAIANYEKEVLKQIINPPQDFEITRFAHQDYTINFTVGLLQIPIQLLKTSINYEFFFYDFLSEVTASTINNWAIDYQNASFTDSEIYYFANNFKGSFFKLDFYDTTDSETQRILLSVIIPTQQGLKEPGLVGPISNQTSVEVKKPKFVLDSVGADKEGFYVYWLKDKNYFPPNEFYVGAKFFNAKKGQFIRMINSPQSTFVGPNVFNINKRQNFYYKYILNYDTYEYAVYTETVNGTLNRRGTIANPIRWYEYVNP